MSKEINYKEKYKKQIEDIGNFLIRNSESSHQLRKKRNLLH